MKYIRVKNWDDFQHYKDRNPPWIKLHQNLITSMAWVMSDDVQRAYLVGIMLLAAKTDNCIENDPPYIQRVLHMHSPFDPAWLIECGFCEYSAEQVLRESPWPSRHIPDELRDRVLKRDGCRCVKCGAKSPLEIDHVLPVSAGGESKYENLQTLCRSCNRRKRNSVATATRTIPQRRIETETETETEGEAEGERERPQAARARFTPPSIDEVIAYASERGFTNQAERFHDYYTGNGWRVGKNPMKDWRAAFRNWEKNAHEFGSRGKIDRLEHPDVMRARTEKDWS